MSQLELLWNFGLKRNLKPRLGLEPGISRVIFLKNKNGNAWNLSANKAELYDFCLKQLVYISI